MFEDINVRRMYKSGLIMRKTLEAVSEVEDESEEEFYEDVNLKRELEDIEIFILNKKYSVKREEKK